MTRSEKHRIVNLSFILQVCMIHQSQDKVGSSALFSIFLVDKKAEMYYYITRKTNIGSRIEKNKQGEYHGTGRKDESP